MRRAVISNKKMGFIRETLDPFLFCVHHLDHYPEGNEKLGPKESLAGRYLGNDFDERNEWKMYHGEVVPGFPAHPHRGFETITIVLEGLVDHFDSGGSTGRYGNGDVQWMTAGSGLMHSEMFPLVNEDQKNTLDLFQIWINLPSKDKMTNPGYEMIWANEVPVISEEGSEIRVISGKWNDVSAPPAPDASWANPEENEVAIYIIKMEKGAKVSLPTFSEDVNRMIYHINGADAIIEGKKLKPRHGMHLRPDVPIEISAEDGLTRLLMLQGKPIKEPVAQHGPFVMNSRNEIIQAFEDYQRTRFGGWKWGASDIVHPREQQRFAKMGDGREFYPVDYN